jgi:cytoskeleton protein RodZ
MQSIGERLKEARERKGVSLREAAEATKIRGDYLQKFEGNKFDFGLTPIYVRSFIRSYANYLKIPSDRLLADLAALGHGEPGVPRAINREVYGKVDFGAPIRAEPRTESPAAAEASAGKTASKPSTPPLRPRPARAVLRRPFLDAGDNHEALLRLGGFALGGVLVVVLLVWGLGSLFSSGKRPATPEARPTLADNTRPIPPDAPAVAQRVPAGKLQLMATGGPVTVRVWEQKPDRSYGRELLAETVLRAGEIKLVDKTGPLYLTASVPDNLQIDTATQSIRLADQKAALKGSNNIAVP